MSMTNKEMRRKYIRPIRNITGATIVWREGRLDRVIRNGKLIYTKYVEGHSQLINPVYWCEVTD